MNTDKAEELIKQMIEEKTQNSRYPLADYAVNIEGVDVEALNDVDHLFDRVLYEIRRPKQSLILYFNIYAANLAFQLPDWKAIFRKGDLIYCDGAGIQWAAKLLGQPMPVRLPAADWMEDLLCRMAAEGKTVYFLAGEPGIGEKALERFNRTVPNHTVVGVHHGYILKDETLENTVIDEINRLKPDLLIIGMGMPQQEFWIERNRHRLNVAAIWPLGAVLDYLTGKVTRCPAWMGNMGFEWLYRLMLEPMRMFDRYVVGNPWFMSRIIVTVGKERLTARMPKKPLLPA